MTPSTADKLGIEWYMRELLYLSVAKMRSFSLDAPQRFFPSREVEVTLVGDAGIRVGPSEEPAAESDSDRLERVLLQLRKSSRAPRDITHAALGPGDWAEFECEVKYGHFHRDKAKVTYRVVLFRGAVPEAAHRKFGDHVPPPESDGTDVLLGGWVGHVIDDAALGDWSHRMGSATDDIYKLWSEVAELDRDGRSQIPREFGHLAEIQSTQVRESLAEVIRSIYGMGTWLDPTAHTDMKVERAYVRGIARVLDVLPADRYQNRLVLGTPLYVEYAQRPEPELEFPQVAPSRWHRVLHRLSRSKKRELGPPPERRMLEESNPEPTHGQ